MEIFTRALLSEAKDKVLVHWQKFKGAVHMSTVENGEMTENMAMALWLHNRPILTMNISTMVNGNRAISKGKVAWSAEKRSIRVRGSKIAITNRVYLLYLKLMEVAVLFTKVIGWWELEKVLGSLEIQSPEIFILENSKVESLMER